MDGGAGGWRGRWMEGQVDGGSRWMKGQVDEGAGG